MKKLILIALMISVSAGIVFAQELKFDGYLNSGMGVVYDDNKDHDTYVKAFGVDSESNGYRFRLNGSYTNQDKNAGVKFRLQGQRTMDLAGYLSMPYLYGWMGFLENKITLTGGLVDDSTWTSADWWWNDDTGEGLGLLFKAEPVKGLNLGVGAYTISQQSGGSNNVLRISPLNKNSSNEYSMGDNRLPNFGELMLKPKDLKYTFNIAYTVPDVLRLGAIFRTKNKAGWDKSRYTISTDKLSYSETDEYGYGGREESMFLQTELRLLAVKNLTAVAVGVFEHLQDFDSRGNIIISETLGYKADKLNFGLNAVQFLYNRTAKILSSSALNDDKVEMNPSLLFNPWISYSFDKVVPRLDLVYFMGGQSKMANTSQSSQQWERKGFATVAKAKEAEDDYSVFSVRPSIKINLDGKTFLEIGDMINYDMATKDGAYKTKDDADKKTLLSNVFYIDVKFSF